MPSGFHAHVQFFGIVCACISSAGENARFRALYIGEEKQAKKQGAMPIDDLRAQLPNPLPHEKTLVLYTCEEE